MIINIYKNKECIEDIYKMYLNDSNVKYICTIYDIIEESVSFYIRYSTDSLTIPEIEIDYDTLTDSPNNVYDEITRKTNNIYYLIINTNYVLSTHTFKGPNGPKCFISFGECFKTLINYFDPIMKHFYLLDLICKKNIKKKIEYKIKNITRYLIVWNINRPNNILKQKDEKVPKNQIGTAVCKVCLNNKVNILFLSCNHAICCIYCSEQLKKCPLCNFLIISKIQINIL
ncbi:hypothetical protein AGMMS49579_01490 [Spirochaetia bacterium]|nr:hypothetical protein AGMMS49579_01490 [Spirochaetia bacterium]